MSEHTSLMQCAIYVLRAFPIREAEVEIPGREVADYFLRHNIAPAQCVVGIRHAVARGWLQLLPGSRMRLLEPGVAFLATHDALNVKVVADSTIPYPQE